MIANLRQLTVLGGCLLISACIDLDTPIHRPGELPELESSFGLVGDSQWLGLSETDLIKARGEPSFRLAVPSGTAYIYETKEDEDADIEGHDNCKDTYLLNHLMRIVSYYCR